MEAVDELPQAGHEERVEDGVGADDGEAFEERLGGEHAVEGVFVGADEGSGQLGVFQLYWHCQETHTCENRLRNAQKDRGLRELAATEFDGGFPNACH